MPDAARSFPRPLPVWVAIAAALLAARPCPAEENSPFETMRLNQQRNLEQSLSNMPPLAGTEKHALGEILRVGMENRNLVVRTLTPATLTPGYARARVPEFDRPVMVRIVNGADANQPAGRREPVVPAELLFQVVDYTRPQRMTTLTLSQTGPGVFNLSRNESSPSGSRNEQFLVQKIPALPGGGAVSLVVSESGLRPGAPPAGVTYSAPDCAAFFRRHPAAVDQYLRPLLAELGQEAVFAPDPLTAEQVFPETATADAAVRRRVELLLPALGDADYRRRDVALGALRDMGRDGAKVLIQLDRAALTPEQNARIDRALSPLNVLPPAEARLLRRDPDFLLNCLYADAPATRRAALAGLKELTGQTVPLPDEADPAARSAAARELRGRMRMTR